jgi:hypothetical protein
MQDWAINLQLTIIALGILQFWALYCLIVGPRRLRMFGCGVSMCLGWIAAFALVGDLPWHGDSGKGIYETGLLTAWLPSMVGVIYYQRKASRTHLPQ